MAQHPKLDDPKPPRPPELGRAFKPDPSQLVGVGALAVLVLLAALGVFGSQRGQVATRDGPLAIEIRHPTRLRYKMIDVIDVAITNTGASDLEAVTIRFDRGLLDAFSGLRFTPAVTTVSGDVYEVELSRVAAGATRTVTVEVQAEAYWRHAGFVEAATPERSIRARLSSFVFP